MMMICKSGNVATLRHIKCALILAFSVLFLSGCNKKVPPEYIGKYTKSGGKRFGGTATLLVTPTGLTASNGDTITWSREHAGSTRVKVRDGNVEITAVYGEPSSWDGFADTTCAGGLTLMGNKLIISLAGPKYCSKFSGEWQKAAN